ncbi:four-carbon acid sugar kinase family protein [Trueperella pyogenes]|uniref:four-carbon acid sugar kinase family protein n=1 Tax=Trueperella pyogenes TaxID=1661 RepID=UPI0032495325
MSTTSLSTLLRGMPTPVPVSAEDVLSARKASNEKTIYIVLDDDPTGTQSVAQLPVLTAWQPEDFRWAFATGAPAIYVMTNSRSLSPADAERVNREVVTSALAAAGKLPLAFISRSDSTLRGHFPLEPLTIADEITKAGKPPIDGIILVPAFGDAGRITVAGMHYAGNEREGFVPVGESEFARDATFGYTASELASWVEEKSSGVISRDDVLTISLTQLRQDHDQVVGILSSATNMQVIVPDIVQEEDLRLLALALIKAEAAGANFVYRVGPPFPRARIGQDIHDPVTLDEIRVSRGKRQLSLGGLIVVGSHVDLTTQQLNHLCASQSPVELELDAARVTDPDTRDAHVENLSTQAAQALNSGNVVISTSRIVITGADGKDSLAISRHISQALVEVVQRILAINPPRFVVAKGGITSSDVAAKGLGFRHATVVGPMLPGIVSLWSGQDGPAAGIPYVVFAGNVGQADSLAAVVAKLSQA